MATSTAPAGLPVIRAAGGIVLRSTPRGEEVMIVFRKRHQDWTLPKGKLKEGESFQEAALREVAEETGCSCRLGDYLGTLSYSHDGTPKVVMFWRMTVAEEKPLVAGDEIAEATWMPLAEAVQRLTHAQEKSLLSRLGGATRPAPVPSQTETPPPAISNPSPAPTPAVPRQERRKSLTLEDQRARARLLREAQAFRIELAFLERRSQQPDKIWAQAATDQLDHATRSLESNDIEGGLLSLQAARRYAVFGLNRAELVTRAQVLREEALRADAGKLSGWRARAVINLLAVPDEQLTAERMAEVMAIHDEEATNQHYQTRLAGDQLRMLLMICGLGAVALAPFMLLEGQARLIAPVLLFGLLGASFSAAHALLRAREPAAARGKGDPAPQNFFVMVTPVLFGAIAGLAGYAIYQYVVAGFSPGPQHTGALLALAFLFGFGGERVLARIAGPANKQPPPRASSSS